MGGFAIKLGIIIQARMGSTRLPGKVLRMIHSKTLLDHILYRLSRLQLDATIVIATSELPQDNVVEFFCRDRGVEYFRGSEKNVLDRYYRCALHYDFKQIVRLTADNPFTDIEELERLIDLHLKDHNDFSHSFGSLPVGVGAEIFTFQALEQSALEGHESHHIEHVDEYMIENPGRFKTGILNVPEKKKRPEIRLTVDTDEDYRKASFIMRSSSNEFINTEEAIELCLQYA